MRVPAQSRAMPNVFNAGNVVKQLIWTRVTLDKALVWMRDNKPIPIPSVKKTKERLPKACRYSSVRHLVYSAMNSPTQPRNTTASEAYSITSQNDNHLEDDATSEGVRIILIHLRRERYILTGYLLFVLVFLIMKIS